MKSTNGGILYKGGKQNPIHGPNTYEMYIYLRQFLVHLLNHKKKDFLKIEDS